MRDSQYSPEISFTHTSLMTLRKILTAFVTLKFFILDNKFSIGFKSGYFQVNLGS